MRVVVLGATGNVGTSVVAALAADDAIEAIVAVARRPARLAHPKTKFVAADISRDDLVPILRGAAAVVHLAWLIQPARDRGLTHAVNVAGSERVASATVAAKVPALVYASSVGAYSPGPKDRYVDETWPTGGVASSFYSRHKVAVERQLDRLERDQPQLRVVRMRPALIFKREAAVEIQRLFIGPLLPNRLVDARWIPFIPDVTGLRTQVVHAGDVGDAYRRAVLSDTRGAYNLAADPPVDAASLAELLDARRVRVPASVLRAAAAATYRLRLQPSEPGWFDMALASPLMDTGHAKSDLGWHAHHSAPDTIRELLAGLRHRAAADTPPLARGATSGPRRR